MKRNAAADGEVEQPVSEIAGLRNLGPKSERWLNALGIYTRQQLAEVGAVEAYHRLHLQGFAPSLVLVYAIEGVLQEVHWNSLTDARKRSLRQEAEL